MKNKYLIYGLAYKANTIYFKQGKSEKRLHDNKLASTYWHQSNFCFQKTLGLINRLV